MAECLTPESQTILKPDRWLISPERTWEEVDQELEARLQGLEWCFSFEEGADFEFGRRYGLEDPPKPDLVRLLAFTAAIDITRARRRDNQRVIDIEEEKYQAQKQAIRRAYGMRGRANRDIDRLDQKKQAAIGPCQDTIQVAERVQDLFLRKAVINIFSVSGGPNQHLVKIEDLPQLVHTARQATISGRAAPSLSARSPVGYFMTSLAGYLTRTQDTELFKRNHYRNSADLIRNLDDCQRLGFALDWAIDPSKLVRDAQEAEYFRRLGRAYLTSLVQAAETNSKLKTGQEKYPLLSLLYDICTVATLGSDIRILRGLGRLIDDVFGEKVIFFQKEIESCLLNQWNVLQGVDDYCYSNRMKLPIISEGATRNAMLGSVTWASHQTPIEIANYVTSPEYRIRIGVPVAGQILDLYRSDQPRLLTSVKAIFARVPNEMAANSLEPTWMSHYEPQAVLNFQSDVENYLKILILLTGLYRKNGIEVDLANMGYKQSLIKLGMSESQRVQHRRWLERRGFVRPEEIPQTQAEKLKSLKAMYYSEASPADTSIRLREIFSTYLEYFWEEPEQ